jgi:UDP-N-acetylmuramate: L-alanyl-gamma-D-glutamyl-meso-diaminopimelate ligase
MVNYGNTLKDADEAMVYFNPKVVEHKKLEALSEKEVQTAFTKDNLKVYTQSDKLFSELRNMDFSNHVLLLMSSGNFDGVNLEQFATGICNQ